MKKLSMLVIFLYAVTTTTLTIAFAQDGGTAINQPSILFAANVTRQTIDRIELASQQQVISIISGVGNIVGLQLKGNTLYFFNDNYDIYATELDNALQPLATHHLGNVSAAGTYAGNSIHVENDGSILTSGQCGIASFIQQNGALAFQAIRFTGANVIRFAITKTDRLYFLTIDGDVYKVPRGRNWAKAKMTSWQIPRPSGFTKNKQGLVGATASTGVVGIPPLCTSPAFATTFSKKKGVKEGLIPEGISGLIQVRSGHKSKIIVADAPLSLNPAVFPPCGITFSGGIGFVVGNRTDQQPGSEIFSFNKTDVIISVLKSNDEYADLVLVEQ